MTSNTKTNKRENSKGDWGFIRQLHKKKIWISDFWILWNVWHPVFETVVSGLLCVLVFFKLYRLFSGWMTSEENAYVHLPFSVWLDYQCSWVKTMLWTREVWVHEAEMQVCWGCRSNRKHRSPRSKRWYYAESEYIIVLLDC